MTQMLLHGAGSGANLRAKDGETALSITCEAGYVGVVRTLLKSGLVNPGIGAGRGASSRLPLQIAAAKGKTISQLYGYLM